MDDNDVNERIGYSLKHVGNVKKRKISKIILTDVLGPKGVKKYKDVKTNRVKTLERENQRIEQVHTAAAYFDCQMEKRMDFLVGNTERSLNKT